MAESASDADYTETEYLYNQFMAPALRAAVSALGLRPGQRVLDAGCGPGGVLPLLAEGVASGGSVLGLDLSLPHVEHARQLARERGLDDSVRVAVADLRADLPIEPASFDAVWTADVLYPDTVGDCAAVVRWLVGALEPGGILGIFFGNWFRRTFLPGYARMEHLICAAREAQYAHERAWEGTFHPERALAWLRGAQLEDCRLQVFPVVYSQPLPAAVREYITQAIFTGHYADAVARCGTEEGMTAADMALWRCLSDPASPDFLLDQPDYYCVATPMLALGQKRA